MATNDENKLLRKVVSKWEQIDKNWQVTDTSDCSNMGEEGENPECDEQLCLKHQKMYRTEVVEMIQSEASADVANKIFTTLDSFIKPIKTYDEDGSSINIPTMDLIEYLEYQRDFKKQHKVPL